MMHVHDHIFVREVAPLELADFCPDCRDPWEYCSCEVPTFDEGRERFADAFFGYSDLRVETRPNGLSPKSNLSVER